MNQKHTIVNFPQIAKNAGFDVFCLPPLKDRYIENHIYQEGGMLYVFLKNPVQATDFRRFAEEHPLVERVLDSKQAAPTAQVIGKHVHLCCIQKRLQNTRCKGS